jgi:hypothetical protein
MSISADSVLGRFNRAELFWLVPITLLILALAAIPYLVAYQSQTPDLLFSGSIFNRSDTAVHHAAMQLGANGEWAYKLRFTAEPQEGAFIKMGYIYLGQLSRLLPQNHPAAIIQAYHFFGALLGILACLCLYFLVAQIFAGTRLRRFAFALGFLGSGAGWLQLILNYLPDARISPIDFWLIDAYPFFGLMILPHFMLLIALMSLMWATYLSYLRRTAWFKIAIAIAAALLMQTISPLTPALATAAIAGSWMVGMRRVQARSWPHGSGALIVIGLSQVPLLAYNLLVLRTDPSFILLSDALEVWTPPVTYLVWGFLGFWPLVILGIVACIKRPEPGPAGALVWLIFGVLMAYNPWFVQRRWLLAITIPMAILSVYGAQIIIRPWLQKRFSAHTLRWQAPLALLFVSGLMLSNTYQVLGYALVAKARPSGLFDPAERVEAVDWLGERADRDAVVLASEQTAWLVASRTDLVGFLGSPFETLNYEAKTQQAADFFTGHSAPGWVKEAGIDWVIVEVPATPAEVFARQAPVFDNGVVAIYEVGNE